MNIYIALRRNSDGSLPPLSLEIMKLIAKTLPNSNLYLSGKLLPKLNQALPEIKAESITEAIKPRCELIIVVGGDGTVLFASSQFPNECPPILTIQAGTIGFMCMFNETEAQQVLQKIEYCYHAENCPSDTFLLRTHLRILGKHIQKDKTFEYTCLNEVCIQRSSKERLILELFINKESINLFIGDGLLISTPTGSTAYNLSAGGPIVQHDIGCIIVTPLSPANMSFRPLCLSAASSIELRAKLIFDGHIETDFVMGDRLVINRSPHDLKIYQSREPAAEPSWLRRLELYLGWNQLSKKMSTIDCKPKL